jgi:DNA replication and repair protein RecF
MFLERLSLKNYRNITDAAIDDIDKGINIIYGNNAAGKTNLLESINYISSGRSFRNAGDIRLIREGEKEASITAGYSSRYSRGKVEIRIIGEEKKSIRINSMPIRKMSELMGVMNSVVFYPDDLKTIKDSPGLRRRMIDVELCKIDPSYYSDLQNFNKVIKNKNILLKENEIDRALIDVYNEQISRYGIEIIRKRRDFVEKLNENSSDFYRNFNDINENLCIIYRSCIGDDDEQEDLRKKLDESYENEIKNRTSIIGPHREDLEILINGKDSKIFASQGQQRTAMLAIKVSFLYIAEKLTGERPILLLDDVFSELDHRRKKILVDVISGIQVFITCTDIDNLELEKNPRLIRVEEGKVQ